MTARQEQKPGVLLARSRIAARLKEAQSSENRLPKYLQLSEAILQLIDEDELRPGDRLPPEAVLWRSTCL